MSEAGSSATRKLSRAETTTTTRSSPRRRSSAPSRPASPWRTAAQNAASDILTKFPNIDGFYVSDDWMGGGLVRALKEKGYEPGQVNIAAAGGSKTGIKDFKDGWYLGIVDQGPELCVYQDILFLRAMFEMGARLPHFAMVRQELINETNIDRFPGTW